MRKQIIGLLLLILPVLVAQAQSLPVVEVTLDENAATRDDVITADVYIRTSIKMIGADVIITVDDACLQIEGQESGTYFPPEDGQSIVLFEETTENSVRRAMNILNFDRIPTADGIYFSISLRVICDEGEANITVESAHLVEFGIVEYKSVEDAVELISNVIAVSPDNAGTNDTQPTPEPEPTPIPPKTGTVQTSEDNAGTNIVILAIGVIVVAGVCLLILLIFYRRSRNKARRKS